jgi:hypothetical protein
VTTSGKWFIGIGGSNENFGIHYDPSGYGDNNLRIRIYDSGSTPRYYDTGLSLITSFFYQLSLQSVDLDNSGNSRIYWKLKYAGTLNDVGSGIWSPGYAISAPTTPLSFGFFTEAGAELICERCSLYTTPG